MILFRHPPTFVKYYRDNYAGRVGKWAMCFRRFEHCKTHTNIFVGSFNNKLKTFFIEKPNKKVDDLYNLLLTINPFSTNDWLNMA